MTPIVHRSRLSALACSGVLMAVAPVALVVGCPISGCTSASCNELYQEYYLFYHSCGADIAPPPPSETMTCPDVYRQALQCYLTCTGASTCEAIRGEDPKAYDELFACLSYCDYFFGVLPEEGSGG